MIYSPIGHLSVLWKSSPSLSANLVHQLHHAQCFSPRHNFILSPASCNVCSNCIGFPEQSVSGIMHCICFTRPFSQGPCNFAINSERRGTGCRFTLYRNITCSALMRQKISGVLAMVVEVKIPCAPEGYSKRTEVAISTESDND